MLFQAIATVVLVLCSIVNANPRGRTDLRITGGVCINEKEDRCHGMGTRNYAIDNLFQRLGRTQSSLQAYKFRRLSTDCTNGGKFNGYQWVDPAKTISHAVLLDNKGTVAGMQFLMPYNEVDMSVQPNYRYDLQPAIQNQTIDGVKYFRITVYFVQPDMICSLGRDENQLQTEGTISRFFIQLGSSPSHVKEISLKSPAVTQNDKDLLLKWDDNNCFRSMGWHRFYDEESWNVDNCATFLPFFLMYTDKNDGGDLNGFGFVVPGKASAEAIERPSLSLTKWQAGTNNNTDNVPKCLDEAHRLLGISSMHVYLSEQPYRFICSNARGSSSGYLDEQNSSSDSSVNDTWDDFDYSNWTLNKLARKAQESLIGIVRGVHNWFRPS